MRITQMPVLVVDDSRSTTAIIRAYLRDMGVKHVDEVNSVEAALTLLSTKNYAAILSDWHMEPMNGPDFLKVVRSLRGSHKPKFAFVSMDDRWSSVATARTLGADAFIVKPDNPRALRDKLSAFMQIHMQ